MSNDYLNRPTGEYPWAAYDNDNITFHRTKDEAYKFLSDEIDNYLHDVWDDTVENLFVAKVEMLVSQTNKKERPNDLDEHGYCKDGNKWLPEHAHICGYEILDL